MSRPLVRPATVDDAAAIADIYNYYVRDTVITFELDEVSVETMGARVAKVLTSGLPWLVAVDQAMEENGAGPDAVLGFAYVAPYRDRAAYDYTLESTVYLRDGESGRGIGSALYEDVIERSRQLTRNDTRYAPVHSLIAVVALPNDGSLALHERFGFAKAGQIVESGRKFDRWIDVGLWQLLLD